MATKTVKLRPPRSSTREFYQTLAAFVDTHMPTAWELEELVNSWVMTIYDGDAVVGHVWFVHLSSDVLEPHIVIHPAYHGKWFSLSILRKLIMIFKHSGAKAIVAQTMSDEMAPILDIIGFERTDDGMLAILKREKVYRDGKVRKEDIQASGQGSQPASGRDVGCDQAG